MTTITQIASTIDELVHRELGDNQFDMYSRLYVTDPDGAWMIGQSHDPYDMFDGDTAVTRPRGATAVGFVCTGWAAPITDTPTDTPPSQSPDRIRVRITVAYNGSEWTTVMRREGENTPDIMEEAGAGPLADAIEFWWAEAEVAF